MKKKKRNTTKVGYILYEDAEYFFFLRRFPTCLLQFINKMIRLIVYFYWKPFMPPILLTELPWWLIRKESACNPGGQGSIPGSGRSPGEGNCNPLQYFGLGNSMDRRAGWATFHGITKGSDTA